jgi:HK97 family phage major capsid protein
MKIRKFAIFGISVMLFIAAMIFATDVKSGAIFSTAVIGAIAMPNLKEDFSGIFAAKTLKECRDLYIDRHKIAMALIDRAKAENRNMTPDELSDYKALNKQLEQLNDEIELATKLDAEKRAEAGIFMKSQRTDATPKSEFRYSDGTPVKTFDRNRAPQKEAGVFADLGTFMRGVISPKVLNVDEKRTLDSLTGSGGYTVPENLSAEIIDMLRQDLALVNAGAVILNLKPGTSKICKIDGDVTAQWKQQAADINLSDPTITDITIVPKTVIALTKLSAELMTDSLNIGEAIKKSMTGAIRRAVEDAAFSGLGGTSYAPVGIDNTSGILEYWLGTNGTALSSFAPLNAVDYQLRSRGVKPSGIITSPGGHAAIMGLIDSTSGQPLQPPKNIASLPIFTSPSISEALTRGTSTTSTTSLYMGNWSDLLIAILEDIEIIIDSSVFRTSNSIAFMAKMRVDFALQHPASIARLSGILPSLTTLQTT